jgi:hypothetical protein
MAQEFARAFWLAREASGKHDPLQLPVRPI